MSAATLHIDGELSIYRAVELKQALLAPLTNGATLDVDLSGVTEFDTAGLQLLMLAMRSAQAAGCEMQLLAPSDAVRDVLDLLDLNAYFGDALVNAPRAFATSLAR